VIGKLRGSWHALDDELTEIVRQIDEHFQELIARLIAANVEYMIESWASVARRADEYRQIAYIDLIPEQEVDMTLYILRHIAW